MSKFAICFVSVFLFGPRVVWLCASCALYVFLFKFHSTVDLAHHYTYMHSKHIHKLFIAMFMRPHCDRILFSVCSARARVRFFSDILICCCCCCGQQIDSICGVDRFRRWCFVCTLCHIIIIPTQQQQVQAINIGSRV